MDDSCASYHGTSTAFVLQSEKESMDTSKPLMQMSSCCRKFVLFLNNFPKTGLGPKATKSTSIALRKRDIQEWLHFRVPALKKSRLEWTAPRIKGILRGEFWLPNIKALRVLTPICPVVQTNKSGRISKKPGWMNGEHSYRLTFRVKNQFSSVEI